jgi:hypothetical protein
VFSEYPTAAGLTSTYLPLTQWPYETFQVGSFQDLYLGHLRANRKYLCRDLLTCPSVATMSAEFSRKWNMSTKYELQISPKLFFYMVSILQLLTDCGFICLWKSTKNSQLMHVRLTPNGSPPQKQILLKNRPKLGIPSVHWWYNCARCHQLLKYFI